jgi:hypothetical protein
VKVTQLTNCLSCSTWNLYLPILISAAFLFAHAFFLLIRAAFFFCTCLFPFLGYQSADWSNEGKKLQLQLENEDGDRTRWHELETLAVKSLGPATRHKEATVNSTSRELSSKAKAQNVFGIFGSKYIFWQN